MASAAAEAKCPDFAAAWDAQASAEWKALLPDDVMRPLLQKAGAGVAAAWVEGHPMAPPLEKTFAAFAHPLPRVVILGQDPYFTVHADDSFAADGLAFSCPPKMQPSLRNILKEVEACTGEQRTATSLTDWAEQGVFLFNTAASVQRKAGVHLKAWTTAGYAEAVMSALARRPDKTVFMLWGKPAQKAFTKAMRATAAAQGHLVLEAPHPSPLSAYRGFFGCGHFALANEALLSWGAAPIVWGTPRRATETL